VQVKKAHICIEMRAELSISQTVVKTCI